MTLRLFCILLNLCLAGYLFLTSSCNSYKPGQTYYRWQYEPGLACCPEQDSARLVLRPRWPCGALQLELIHDCCSTNMYLSTVCYVLSEAPCPKTVDVAVITCDQKQHFKADLFEGAQRCLLPDEARDLIIEELLANECVEIVVGIHRAEITSCNFWHCYRRLF